MLKNQRQQGENDTGVSLDMKLWVASKDFSEMPMAALLFNLPSNNTPDLQHLRGASPSGAGASAELSALWRVILHL